SPRLRAFLFCLSLGQGNAFQTVQIHHIFMNLIKGFIFYTWIEPACHLFGNQWMILNFKMVQAIENRLVCIRNFELETWIGMLTQSTLNTHQVITDDMQGLVPAGFKLEGAGDQIGNDMRRNRSRISMINHNANPKRIMVTIIMPDAAMT